MQARYFSPAALALAVILVGCTPAATPPAPAPDTHDADVKALHDLEAAWVQNFATKDVDKVASVYADDASVYLPGTPVISGMTAIKAALTPMLADKNYAITFAATGIEVAKGGDVAYSHGTFSQTSTDPKTKKAVTEKGKYLTIYKKQADGGWKAVEDSINNDGPPTPVKK
jgi:uncharacterized protein (TIGR02246 family)